MSFSSLEQRREQAERIKEQYEVIVPSFVYKHPPIDPKEAAQLAIALNLVSYDPNRGKDRYQLSAEQRGLHLCRMFGVDIKGAYDLPGERLSLRQPMQFGDLFPSGKSVEETSAIERQRREIYHAELLQLEIDILRRRGVTIPSYSNLVDNNYLLYPYSEESIEKKLRAHEPVSIDFCLAVVPASPTLFPDIQGQSTSRIVFGERTLMRWGKHYQKTGKLWTDNEKERIKAIAENIPVSRKRVFDGFYWF